jgi:hypothetical protein
MQALYYWLRTYLLERRDIATKTDVNRGAANRVPAQMGTSAVSTFGNSSEVAPSTANTSSDTSPSMQMPLSTTGNQVLSQNLLPVRLNSMRVV